MARRDKLTEKQEKFAVLVGVEGVNQSEAYRRVYSAENMAEKTVWVKASTLAKLEKVAERIEKYASERRNAASAATSFDVVKLLETYIAIAFVDPNELIATRVGACRHCWGVGGAYQWKEREYMQAVADWECACDRRKPGEPEPPMPDPSGGFGYRFTAAPNPDCDGCEGEGIHRVVPMDTTKLSPGAKLLYRGVQQTKDGIKVLFRDQDKALDQVGRILGAYDDKLRLDLQGKMTSLKLMTSDPKEAADAYQKMIAGGS